MDGCQFPDSAGGVPGAFLSGLDVALARLGKDAFRRQGEFASPQDGFPLQRAAKAPDAAPEVLEECLLRHRRQDDDVCQIAEDVGNGAVFLRHGRLMVPGLGVIRPEPGGMVGTSAYGQFPREWGLSQKRLRPGVPGGLSQHAGRQRTEDGLASREKLRWMAAVERDPWRLMRCPVRHVDKEMIRGALRACGTTGRFLDVVSWLPDPQWRLADWFLRAEAAIDPALAEGLARERLRRPHASIDALIAPVAHEFEHLAALRARTAAECPSAPSLAE